jgi:hypothetical protein
MTLPSVTIGAGQYATVSEKQYDCARCSGGVPLRANKATRVGSSDITVLQRSRCIHLATAQPLSDNPLGSCSQFSIDYPASEWPTYIPD